METSEFHSLLHIENAKILKDLLENQNLDGIHLFCSFDFDDLPPKLIRALEKSELQSISFNDAHTLYPAFSRS
ncbi:hypothetical protein BTO00_22790 [Vibrio campbellii]|uniref:hypothetical protein n=1 Tax=Vibrio campbellii TaxID=680 RepID=UPI000CF3E6C4|nr:hypothetical protein [Vibrio campbellii]PQJ37910.1 hypothetical protein BTO00_22790 [Vibrio campbellii]